MPVAAGTEGAADSPGPGPAGGQAPALPPARRGEPLQRLLFGGVYGTVLASTLASALDHDTGAPDPGYDALWILIAAVASAAAHGYAHAIAHRTADGNKVTWSTVRSVATEWPLVAAALPAVAALAGSRAGWWGEAGAVTVTLAINTVALFGWGLWGSRAAGERWPRACRAGVVDVLLGACIIAVNVATK
jgi:hypothetical protein